MSGPPGAIRDVADTAGVTVLCRALDAVDEAGLLQDVFAARFLADLRSTRQAFEDIIGDRQAYIVTRAHIVDVLLMEAVEAGARVLWHFGAGYDCRPYRLELPDDFVTIEVDAAELLARKSALLAGERPRGTVHRVAGDLTNARGVVEALARSHPPSGPVVALTEGVTPYLTADHLRDLAAALAPACRRWITDVISVATAQAISDRLERAGARVDAYGLESFAAITAQGWTVEGLVPLLAAVRRLRPDSPSARVMAAQRGMLDAVATLALPEIDTQFGAHHNR